MAIFNSYFDVNRKGYQGFDPYKKHVKHVQWNREIQMNSVQKPHVGWWLVRGYTTFHILGIIISHELWIPSRSPSSIMWKPRYSGIKTMVSCKVSLKSIHWSCYIPLYRQFFGLVIILLVQSHFFSISPVQFSYIGYIPITSHDSFYPITSPLIGY